MPTTLNRIKSIPPIRSQVSPSVQRILRSHSRLLAFLAAFALSAVATSNSSTARCQAAPEGAGGLDAAPPESAPAQPSGSTDVILTLTDGSTVVGAMIELVPRDHVTVRTELGETRIIPWTSIARLRPAASTAGPTAAPATEEYAPPPRGPSGLALPQDQASRVLTVWGEPGTTLALVIVSDSIFGPSQTITLPGTGYGASAGGYAPGGPRLGSGGYGGGGRGPGSAASGLSFGSFSSVSAPRTVQGAAPITFVVCTAPCRANLGTNLQYRLSARDASPDRVRLRERPIDVEITDDVRGFYLYTHSRQRLRRRWIITWSAVTVLGLATMLGGVYLADPHGWTPGGRPAYMQGVGATAACVGPSMLLMTWALRDLALVRVVRSERPAAGDSPERTRSR